MKGCADRCGLWLSVVIVCLLAVAVEIALASRYLPGETLPHPAGGAVSRVLGVHFVVADFDGDWKPDLAIVESANPRHAPGNYAIRLQLSAAAEVSFLVTIPSGGVRVAARDVNGDNLLDVIVSSISDERVVAVLLNHGHGVFSRAEPSSYVGMPREPDTCVRGCEQSLADKLTVASLRYSFDGERMGNAVNPAPLPSGRVAICEVSLRSPVALHPSRGRSPPVPVFPT